MRTRLLATIAALSLTLTACGGDQEPEADPPTPIQSSATPSPTPSDDPSGSPSPSEANTTAPSNSESLRDFAIRWLAVGDEMQVTGNTAAYRRISASECQPCADIIALIKSIYSNGGKVQYDGSTLKSISDRKSAAGLTEFRLTFAASETTYSETKGGPTKSTPEGDVTFVMTVRKHAGNWIVVDFASPMG